MKAYVKLIRWKQAHACQKAHDEHDKEDCSPCIDCVEQCTGVECVRLMNWFHGKDEAVVERDICHDYLIIARIICRVAMWMAFFALLWSVSCRWIELKKYMIEQSVLVQSNGSKK